jgi:hypothetical protein
MVNCKTGEVRRLHDDRFKLPLETVHVTRASHIEYEGRTGLWVVYTAPKWVNWFVHKMIILFGKAQYRNASREACGDWEKRHLDFL